jgi:hypothetical protein
MKLSDGPGPDITSQTIKRNLHILLWNEYFKCWEWLYITSVKKVHSTSEFT